MSRRTQTSGFTRWGEMTEQFFFELLSLTGDFEVETWRSEKIIRKRINRTTYDEHCPITAVCEVVQQGAYPDFRYPNAAKVLNLNKEFANRIARAADSIREDWEARRDIERACNVRKLLPYYGGQNNEC